jgi:hypothetical protein
MRLVLIEWEDSHSASGWQRIGGPIEDRVLICRSAGWLILDGERAKVIAPHVNEPEDRVELQGAGVMTIPAHAVLRLVDLAQHGTSYERAPTCVPASCPGSA